MSITVTSARVYINLDIVPVLVPVEGVEVFEPLFLKLIAATFLAFRFACVPLIQV